MSDEVRDPFNPLQYVEHITRTAMLLENLAKDVRDLRDHLGRVIESLQSQLEESRRETNSIRATAAALERESAVFRERTTAEIAANREAIGKIAEGQQWLRRLVLSGIIGAILSGLAGLVWAALK